MTFESRKIALSIAVLGAALAAGCAKDANCDEDLGEVYQNGICLPVGNSPSPPTMAPADAGGDGALSAACESADPPFDFGDACSDTEGHTDCGCEANICAAQPGTADGFCTKIDCDDATDPCPDGWTCTDLSSIDPTYPPTCLPPG